MWGALLNPCPPAHPPQTQIDHSVGIARSRTKELLGRWVSGGTPSPLHSTRPPLQIPDTPRIMGTPPKSPGHAPRVPGTPLRHVPGENPPSYRWDPPKFQ